MRTTRSKGKPRINIVKPHIKLAEVGEPSGKTELIFVCFAVGDSSYSLANGHGKTARLAWLDYCWKNGKKRFRGKPLEEAWPC